MLREIANRRSGVSRLSAPTRLVLLGVAAGLVAACGSKTPPATSAPPPAAVAEAPVSPPARPAAGAPSPAGPAATPSAPAPLLGHLSEDDLRRYEPWVPVLATPYVPDAGAITTIASRADKVTILLVLGTWCRDSKRELPRFLAIVKAAGVPESAVTMVGVDRTKRDPEGLTETWRITRVPTFVVFRSGQEIGRVVERIPAGTTFEVELARILSGGSPD